MEGFGGKLQLQKYPHERVLDTSEAWGEKIIFFLSLVGSVIAESGLAGESWP